MPIEHTLLYKTRCKVEVCPVCEAAPFETSMRGCVQRSKHPWYDPFGWFTRERPYCAVICNSCDEIVGFEMPGLWEGD